TRTSGGRGGGSCWRKRSTRLYGPGRVRRKGCGRPNAYSTSLRERYGVAESTVGNLRAGNTRSCGCLRREATQKLGRKKDRRTSTPLDLTGRRFGRLRAIELDAKRSATPTPAGVRVRYWRCRCRCGSYVSV